MDVIIRVETPADYRTVENLTRESFWNVYKPGADEHYYVHRMRSHPDFIPELAFDATFPAMEKKWMPSQEEFYIYSHSSVVR